MNNISLRVLEKEDTDFLHRLFNDPAIMAYWFDEAYHAKAKIEANFDKFKADQTQRRFILQNDNEPLGMVALYEIDFVHRKAEFAIMLDPTKQGNGYALPATKLAIDYAFKTLNLHKLFLIVDEKNEKAIHVYKKAGFQPEATLKDEYFVNGSYHNAVYMSILQEDYLHN